jgi:putative addiction module CopG family antidote
MATGIPPDFEHYIEESLAVGRYQSAEEAVQEAFRLLRERDRQHEALRADIKAGFDEIARGEGIELDQRGLRQLFDEIQVEGRARYEAAKKDR